MKELIRKPLNNYVSLAAVMAITYSLRAQREYISLKELLYLVRCAKTDLNIPRC